MLLLLNTTILFQHSPQDLLPKIIETREFTLSTGFWNENLMLWSQWRHMVYHVVFLWVWGVVIRLLCLCFIWRVGGIFYGRQFCGKYGGKNELVLTWFSPCNFLQALAHKTLVLLLGVDPSRQLDHPLPTVHPQVTYAYMKHMWKSARKVQKNIVLYISLLRFCVVACTLALHNPHRTKLRLKVLFVLT